MNLASARLLVVSEQTFGGPPGAFRRAVREGALVRMHPGRFVAASEIGALYPEQRHLVHIAAACGALKSAGAVFSHTSAAVLWGLPVPRTRLVRVHLSGSRNRGTVNAEGGIARHDVRVADDDVCLREGERCTTLARTVIDVCRSLGPEAAISAIDAAFRLVAWDEQRRVYDGFLAEAFREELRARLATLVGGRGIVQARRMVELADGRAHLPGESISRLYLTDLGFARLRVQAPIAGPGGTRYFSDIAIDDIPAHYEFDGVGKYIDPDMTGGRSVRQVVDDEKGRENWIRMTTGWIVIRAGDPQIASRRTLAQHLSGYGVELPRR